MSRASIGVVSNLPRSGGTLISRCLGCMQRIVLLSEIHPFGTRIDRRFDPLLQACYWHGLIQPEELPKARLTFAESIALIEERCRDRGLQLVIRDWAYLDYMGVPYVTDPPHRSRLVEALSTDFDLHLATLVRHPLEVWLSLLSGQIIRHHLTPEKFAEGYLAHTRQAILGTYLRYEDFLVQPSGHIEHLCQALGVDFDPGFLEKWSAYDRITGDTANIGQANQQIRPLRPRTVAADIQGIFENIEDYAEARGLLGYGILEEDDTTVL